MFALGPDRHRISEANTNADFGEGHSRLLCISVNMWVDTSESLLGPRWDGVDQVCSQMFYMEEHWF